MPVYKTRSKKKIMLASVRRISGNRRRIFAKRRKWDTVGNNIEQVELHLGFPIQKHVAELCKTKKPTVVEFGCAKGFSTADVARQNTSARVYGFSAESYRMWDRLLNKDPLTNKPNPKLKFVHGEASDFGRYFRNNSVDLLYSKSGLLHVPDQIAYLKTLVPKLTVGGVLITDLNLNAHDLSLLVGKTRPQELSKSTPYKIGGATHYKQEITEVYTLPKYQIKLLVDLRTITITRLK